MKKAGKVIKTVLLTLLILGILGIALIVGGITGLIAFLF